MVAVIAYGSCFLAGVLYRKNLKQFALITCVIFPVLMCANLIKNGFHTEYVEIWDLHYSMVYVTELMMMLIFTYFLEVKFKSRISWYFMWMTVSIVSVGNVALTSKFHGYEVWATLAMAVVCVVLRYIKEEKRIKLNRYSCRMIFLSSYLIFEVGFHILIGRGTTLLPWVQGGMVKINLFIILGLLVNIALHRKMGSIF